MPGATKYCCYGNCNSDSRTGRPGFSSETKFFPFPKPCLDFRKSSISKYSNALRKEYIISDTRVYLKTHISSCETCKVCEKWLYKCRRADGKLQSIADITKDTYICSKHFPENVEMINPNEHLPGEQPKKKRRVLEKLVTTVNTNRSISDSIEYHGLLEIGGFTENDVHEEALFASPDETHLTDWLSHPNEIVIANVTHQDEVDITELSCSRTGLTQNDVDEEALFANQDETNLSQLLSHHHETDTANLTRQEHDEMDLTELSRGRTEHAQNSLTQAEESFAGGFNTSGKIDASTQTEQENADAAAHRMQLHDQETVTSMHKKIFDLQSKVEELEKEIRLREKQNRRCEKLEMAEAIDDFEMNLKQNEKMSKFYLGFTYAQIELIMQVLDVKNIKYWNSSKATSERLTHTQEFIITLLRLRGGLLVEDIAYRFHLSTGLVSTTTTTWIQLMYCKFEPLKPSMLASREKVREHLPKRFRNLPNIRVIIDCAEFFCETPTDFGLQSNTYSQYKAHATFKTLVGCSPNGCINFVSDLYEGSISDRELFMKSGLVEMLNEDDLVLADRGFQIQDTLNEKNIHLNIPAFLKGRDKFTPEEVIETRNIAKNRIFVECIVRRLKEFRFLDRIVPLNMRGVVSQIVFVCACLSNFNAPLLIE